MPLLVITVKTHREKNFLTARPPPLPAGDDLSLCLRAVCWLAPRFADLPSSSAAPEPPAATLGDDDARRGENSAAAAAAAAQDEPLQLLLELAAGRLGTGVDGIHTSLSLMAGALCPRGLKTMGVRRAFASSLRAHLATVHVDSVFRFGAPKNLVAAGGDGMPSPGRLALPPMLNWATFRKYTATMWVRLDPDAEGGGGGGGGPATLFRFRNGDGVGVEATLSAAAGAGGAGVGGKGHQQGRREVVVTSFQRASSSKSFSARCRFGPQAEAVHLGGGGVGEGVRQGGWRFVVVSHGQPYVKRSGRLRVSVDGGVVLDTELQYPPATGQGAKDPMSR